MSWVLQKEILRDNARGRLQLKKKNPKEGNEQNVWKHLKWSKKYEPLSWSRTLRLAEHKGQRSMLEIEAGMAGS